MNRVTGRVLLQETGEGVADLVVTVYDVDRDAESKPATSPGLRTGVLDRWDDLRGERLGSVVTGRHGEFALQYGDSDSKAGRPDLLLFVTAPERAHDTAGPALLHVSRGIRQSAGRVESYLITLTWEVLEQAGVSVRTAPAPGANRVKLAPLDGADDRRRTLTAGLDKVRTSWRAEQTTPARLSDAYRASLSQRPSVPTADSVQDTGFQVGMSVVETADEAATAGNPDAGLRFTGVVAADSLPPDQRPAGSIGVVVDRGAGTYRITIASLPVRGRAEEIGPGALVMANLARRHQPTPIT